MMLCQTLKYIPPESHMTKIGGMPNSSKILFQRTTWPKCVVCQTLQKSCSREPHDQNVWYAKLFKNLVSENHMTKMCGMPNSSKILFQRSTWPKCVVCQTLQKSYSREPHDQNVWYAKLFKNLVPENHMTKTCGMPNSSKIFLQRTPWPKQVVCKTLQKFCSREPHDQNVWYAKLFKNLIPENHMTKICGMPKLFKNLVPENHMTKIGVMPNSSKIFLQRTYVSPEEDRLKSLA